MQHVRRIGDTTVCVLICACCQSQAAASSGGAGPAPHTTAIHPDVSTSQVPLVFLNWPQHTQNTHSQEHFKPHETEVFNFSQIAYFCICPDCSEFVAYFFLFLCQFNLFLLHLIFSIFVGKSLFMPCWCFLGASWCAKQCIFIDFWIFSTVVGVPGWKWLTFLRKTVFNNKPNDSLPHPRIYSTHLNNNPLQRLLMFMGLRRFPPPP